jgi:hypothetical protein
VRAHLRLVVTQSCRRIPFVLASSLDVEAVRDDVGALEWERDSSTHQSSIVWVSTREDAHPGQLLALEFKIGGDAPLGLWQSSTSSSASKLCYSLGADGPEAAWFPRPIDPHDEAWVELECSLPQGIDLHVADAWQHPQAAQTLNESEHGEVWQSNEVMRPSRLSFVTGPLRELRIEDENLGSAWNVWVSSDVASNQLARMQEFARVADQVGRSMGAQAGLASAGQTPNIVFLPGLAADGVGSAFVQGDTSMLAETWLTECDHARIDREWAMLVAHAFLPQWAQQPSTGPATPDSWWMEGLAHWLAIDALDEQGVRGTRNAAFVRLREEFLAEGSSIALLEPKADANRERLAAGGACLLEFLAARAGRAKFRSTISIALSEVDDRFLERLELGTRLDINQLTAAWRAPDGPPLLQLRWKDDASGERILVTTAQHHAVEEGRAIAFEFHVPISIGHVDGEVAADLSLAKRRELIRIPRTKEPLYLRLASDSALPARIEIEQDQEAWAALLIQSKDDAARLSALAAIGAANHKSHAIPSEASLSPESTDSVMGFVAKTIRDSSQSTSFRSACAGWYAASRAHDVEHILSEVAMNDPVPRLRIVSVTALRKLVASLRAEGRGEALAKRMRSMGEALFLRPIDADQRAAAAALVAVADPNRAFEFLRLALNEDSHGDLLRVHVLRLIAQLKDERTQGLLRSVAERADASLAARFAAVRWLDSRDLASSATLMRASTSNILGVRIAALQAQAKLAGREPRVLWRMLGGFGVGN